MPSCSLCLATGFYRLCSGGYWIEKGMQDQDCPPVTLMTIEGNTNLLHFLCRNYAERPCRNNFYWFQIVIFFWPKALEVNGRLNQAGNMNVSNFWLLARLYGGRRLRVKWFQPIYRHEQSSLSRIILWGIEFLKYCCLFFKLVRCVIALGNIVRCFLWILKFEKNSGSSVFCFRSLYFS